MKRDGGKRSHCLTVCRIWRIWTQSLGWRVIGLHPGLAYCCLSLNSLCLPGPIQSGMLRWRAKCLKVCLSFPDFTLSAFFRPNTRSTSVPVSVATRAAGRGGRKKKRSKWKGCRAALFDKLHAHPMILMSPHAWQGHSSHPLGEFWSPAGLGGTCRPAGKTVWSPRIPLGPKSNEKRSTIQLTINLHSEWTGEAANNRKQKAVLITDKPFTFESAKA